jgi:hypothetical protein
MLKRTLIRIAVIGLIMSNYQSAQSQSANRKVSERILQLAKSSTKNCDLTDVPYCYLFKATVDIDSGYLRVWKTDELGNDYVVQQLRKDETVYVRSVFTYKNVKRAQLSVMTKSCMVLSCSGSVDLRYLR